jgi:hypothetical protein
MPYNDSELDNFNDFAAACAELIRLTDILHGQIGDLGTEITDGKLDAAQDTATAAMGAISTFLAVSEALRSKT